MTEFHTAFCTSQRRHILMITNHGIHQWKVIPGLPDTGGQNVFVNQFSDALVAFGFRVTIVNRGGFDHPQTGKPRQGLDYRDEHSRILYIEDGTPAFVRKEDMAAQIESLVENLNEFLAAEQGTIDLILSHYWDGAKVGIGVNRSLPARVPHVWTPHSLGTVKKRNMAPETWGELRVDERIEIEKGLIGELDGIAATSSIIRDALADDYGHASELYLPPCVDEGRYHPKAVADDDPIWGFVSEHCGLSQHALRQAKIITEISRTDRTKRKDVLIRAFAAVHQTVPSAALIVSIDANAKALHDELQSLIDSLGLRQRVAVVGSIWDKLPHIYRITSVYCTPSVMEGFGMSIQEAAATAVPAVSSDLVPFAVEHLLGPSPQQTDFGGRLQQPVRQGRGAIVVPADDVDGFAQSIQALLSDDARRQQMGQGAHSVTIPYFTWKARVKDLLDQIGIEAG